MIDRMRQQEVCKVVALTNELTFVPGEIEKSRDDLKSEAEGKPKTSHEAEGDPTPDSGF